MSAGKPRAAVVGAGPSGFYTAGQLLAEGFAVDLIDMLPVPFGLVRFGVAPDHPKIKNVTRVYEKTAAHEDFRYFGGVTLGEDITRKDLLERYEAVVYCTGTSADNRLGIDGEDLPGSHAATEFVAWYNGHPHYADRQFDLSAERAVVVGNGNVAIDVARMLVLDADELAPTDTADHAIEALSKSNIKEVILLGRRGPAQAAFTNPELLELGELQRADVIVDPADLELDAASEAWLASDEADATSRKNVEILREYAQREPTGKSHRVVLKFLSSPLKIIGDEKVEAIEVGHNRIQAGEGGALRAVATGESETIECGLVFRSIGYRGRPVDDIPFEPKRGLIRNVGGRVCDDAGQTLAGEYCVGWIKRGPSGVIGTNKKDATDTVARIIEDRDAGKLGVPTAEGDPIDFISERVPHFTSWEGWGLIDTHEQGLGEPQGRPRVKLIDVDEMTSIAAGAARH
ncbi:MAG: FAD-dependent oxidoreductase [Actinobacteria bacterium]|nr:FAD-dependent oxidoreductase [Actinomycetota bacterium]